MSQVETEDLVEFGIIPEFIGRFSNIVALDPLKAEDLVGVMVKTQNSALKNYKALFALHGIDLVFTKGALQEIATQAAALQTGARAINRIIKKHLSNWEYQLPELSASGVSQIKIDEYTIWEGQAHFKYYEKPQESVLDKIRDQNTNKVYSLTITEYPISVKIPLIRIVRSYASLGLKESKEIIESLPNTVEIEVDYEDLEELKQKLKKLRVVAEISQPNQNKTVVEDCSQKDLISKNKINRKTIVKKESVEISYSLTIKKYPRSAQIPLLKIIRSCTGLGLRAALAILRCPPKTVELELTQEYAEKLQKELIDLGVTAEIIPIKGNSKLMLVKYPFEQRLKAIEIIRSATDLSLNQATELIASILPVIVKKDLSRNKAEKLRQKFIQIGAEVKVF